MRVYSNFFPLLNNYYRQTVSTTVPDTLLSSTCEGPNGLMFQLPSSTHPRACWAKLLIPRRAWGAWKALLRKQHSNMSCGSTWGMNTFDASQGLTATKRKPNCASAWSPVSFQRGGGAHDCPNSRPIPSFGCNLRGWSERHFLCGNFAPELTSLVCLTLTSAKYVPKSLRKLNKS